MTRNSALLLAAVALGCSSSAPAVGVRLRTPSAIASFRGLTEKHPGTLAPYVAVANAGNEQLTLLDPRDDKPVMSPGLVFPLAVPTSTSPLYTAAAPLADGGADALVVAGAPDPATGDLSLQLVVTWDGRPRPGQSFRVGGGGEVVLGIVGVPVPQDAPAVGGVVPAVTGAARFLVSVSGGRLVAVRATRQGDGGIVLADEGSLALGGAGTPFDVVAIAPSPDGRRVYAASPDVVRGTDGTEALGVAEIDTLGADPAAWTVRALSARASTYAVAAANVFERVVASPDQFDRAQLESGTPRLLVYALIESTSCGQTAALPCGVVTLDPALGGLAEDPVGEMPFRAPMSLPVVPTAIGAWDRAPAEGADGDQILSNAPVIARPGIRYTPGTGVRVTSALGLVTGADGHVYSLDLGRWGPGLDSSMLRPSAQTRVESVTFTTDPAVAPQIGMWNDDPAPLAERKVGDPPTEPPVLETTSGRAGAAMLVTPGYTSDESWVLGWQYPLPGLVERHGTLVRDPSLGLVVAMQAADPDVQGAWLDTVGLYWPALGIHVGDPVEVALEDDGTLSANCKARGEGRVDRILPPDPVRWPGGALVLSPPVNPPVYPNVPPRGDVYACWTTELPTSTVFAGRATVYSGEWVLLGGTFGYAGRPEPEVRYRLQYPGRTTDGGYVEEQLAAACTLPAWPAPGQPVPACEGDCRTACEQLAIARKARRFYYPQDTCEDAGVAGTLACAVTGHPGIPARPADPTTNTPATVARVGVFDVMAPGPVIEFRFGLNPASVTAEHPIVRAANVTWRTFSGYDPSDRAPSYGGEATGLVGFDRSPFHTGEPKIVFYVSYTGNAVYEAALGAFTTESKTIR